MKGHCCRKILPTLLLCVFSFASPWIGTPSAEGILSYQDKQGRTHFVDRLDAIPQEFREQARNREDLPQLNKVPSQKFEGVYAPPPQRVTILVAEWCGYCRKLESFLKDNKIRYSKFDVERSTQGRRLYSKFGAGGIPITIVDKTNSIRGFNPQAILAALRKKLPVRDIT